MRLSPRWLPLVSVTLLVLACAPAAPRPQESGAAAGPAAGGDAPAASGAPAPAGAPAAPMQRATVRFGGLSGSIDRALFVGEEKGYYAEQGIDLEVEPFTSAADMIPALATGGLDAGHGGTSPGFYNAIVTGALVKIVADVTILRHPDSAPGIKNSIRTLVRKELVDSGQVRSVADLKGRTASVNVIGAQSQKQLDQTLTHHGLKLEDVELVVVSIPDTVAALANGRVDFVNAIEPTITLAENNNVGLSIFDLGYSAPGQQVQLLFYSPQFTDTRPDVARRFMVGYLQALRYIEDAYRKNINRAEVVQMFVKHTPVKDAGLWERMGFSYNEPNGNVNMEWLEKDQQAYLRFGTQRQRVDPQTMVDTRFAQHAVQVLGRYEE